MIYICWVSSININIYIYISKQRPHARVHEVLSYGSLILHLEFFYLFSLRFFNCYLKSPLIYFYCYKKDGLPLTIRPSIMKSPSPRPNKKDALQIQWLFEAINAEAWEISAFGLLGFKAITSRSSQFYALYTR